MNPHYPRGKRVSPVDYSLYAVERPKSTGYVVRNRSNPCNFIDISGRLLFSSFSPTGYGPRNELRWLHGSARYGSSPHGSTTTTITTRRLAALGSVAPLPHSLSSREPRRPLTAGALLRQSLTPVRPATPSGAEGMAPAAGTQGELLAPVLGRRGRLVVRNELLVVQDNAMSPPSSSFIGADAGCRVDPPITLSSCYSKRILRIVRGTVAA